MMNRIKKADINLVPDTVNPTPDYYCTWQTQLYATNDGKPKAQRAIIGEKGLFDKEKPYGWAYFYQEARRDLFLVMDDSWDVPLEDDPSYYGCLILNEEKFPTATDGAKTNAEALKRLSDRIKALGWKGFGGWVSAQESEKFVGDKTPEEYWTERLSDAHKGGFAYWKVDWGKKGMHPEFRTMLTELGRKFAPDLVIEQAMIKELIPCSDVFRTYDVPAIMSIPMTMEKLRDLSAVGKTADSNMGLINCEDEAYIAAAGGFAMGIMRHPYSGAFIDGRADMSFPEVHRNLKTKMYEVIRAVRWHRIAPAFGIDSDSIYIATDELTDTWRFVEKDKEMEEWWFRNPLLMDSIRDRLVTRTAPSRIARGVELPQVCPDEKGNVPFVVAAKNPNGAISVVTAGRTFDREYIIPKCDVNVKSGDADIVAAFGEYKNLILETTHTNISAVLMQDLAGDEAFDVTDAVQICRSTVSISGDLIHWIGTMTQPDSDTSEPGTVIKLFVH